MPLLQLFYYTFCFVELYDSNMILGLFTNKSKCTVAFCLVKVGTSDFLLLIIWPSQNCKILLTFID